MKIRISYSFLLFSIILFSCSNSETIKIQKVANTKNIPHLIKQEKASQLMVDDKPFLILGGELGNSTFTSLESMAPVWGKLKKMNINTILAPVYWELIEPKQGNFDFKLLDDLITEARAHNFKLIILWFGSWKNSMSSHAPSWIKTNYQKYPLAKSKEGVSQEILSPFSKENLQADLKAFSALMQHIKDVDSTDRTIIMIQAENEIGMLPSARDYHSLANEKISKKIPKEFADYLIENKQNLNPEFLNVWQKNGFKTFGTWHEVFGKGEQTDEIFMAWYYAKFTNEIVKAGKEIYPLPMFVNAALNRPNAKPGEYPSAGPLPHLMDVWKAAGTSIDMFSPDFYFPNIKYWCDLYTRQNNPLFIPEHQFDNTVSAKALFTIGHYKSLGFSPFSIEQIPELDLLPKEEKLAKTYNVINQIHPILHQNQNKVEGVLLNNENKKTVFTLGDYEFTANHTYNLGWEANSSSNNWEPSGAIIVQTKENEFYYVGFGVSFTFKNKKNLNGKVGILKAEKGYFEGNQWKVYQHLNGDQTHQGRHIRSFLNDVNIQRFELYTYE
tara:strand:- start:3677 stop:5341 length:1665 start_codon:yes stop_codon:yes gene_type:complete